MVKRYFTIRSLSLLALSLCTSGLLFAQSWQVVGNAGFAASGSGVCNWQRLLIDEYNTPYLSYNDEGFGMNNGQGTVMRFDGTAWVAVGAAGFTSSFSHHSDFTFGSGDTIYYSYADGTSSAMSSAAVMRYDGTSWTTIGSALSSGACQYTSLAMSEAGILYLGMIDNGIPNGGMVVKQYDGSTWTSVGSSPISTASGAAYADMALSPHDTLYVAYQDVSEIPGKVRVKKFDGQNWVNVGTPLLATTGPGAGPAMDIYIGFDINGAPYVSYSHTFQGPPRISVEKFDGSSWTLVGPAQFSSGQFETSLFSSMVLPKNAPYVAYQHGGLGMKCTVKKYNTLTSAWENVGAAAVSDDVAAHTSIALDGNGNVYVAYFDQLNGGKNTVKKFTVCDAPVVQSVVAENTPVCGDSATLKVTGLLNDATQWQWFSGSCNNGTLIGSGDSIKVKPAQGTTYYVKGMGGCVISGPCQEIIVDVAMATPVITLNNNVFSSSASSGNQWYRNNAAISGATAQTYTATQSGEYFTRVTDGDCSLNSDTLTFEPNGIGDMSWAASLSVYPNPADQVLNLKIDAAIWSKYKNWTAQVYDITGRPALSMISVKAGQQIDISALSSGLYWLKVGNNEGMQIVKFVKQ